MYYINPMYFYLLNVSAELKIFLCALGFVALVVTIFILITWGTDSCANIFDMDDDEKKIFKIFKNVIIASIITIFIGILIPSKETCVEMMIASQVTHENVAATKEEIYEIVDYVTDKMNGGGEEE